METNQNHSSVNMSLPCLSKTTVAKDLVAAVPERALQIIMGGDFRGADLVRLASEIHRPSFKDMSDFIFQNVWELRVEGNLQEGITSLKLQLQSILFSVHSYSFVCTQDIAANYVWLKALVAHFPESVPGGVLLTDVWLMVDSLLDNKLFVRVDLPRQNQAALEADRCKKLMGALRYLYRNSSSL